MPDKINGRTAEEIKKKLMLPCGFHCEGCRADDICDISRRIKNALALIEQLEAERDALKRKLDERNALLAVLGVSIPDNEQKDKKAKEEA